MPAKINLDKNIIQKIIYGYLEDGKTCSVLSQEFGLSLSKISNTLIENGVQKRHGKDAQFYRRDKIISIDQQKVIDKIKFLYLNENKTLKEIGKELNCSRGCLHNLLNKAKLDITRDTSQCHQKWKINQNVFDKNVHNWNKYYWLGFLAGDGSIRSKKIANDPLSRDSKSFYLTLKWEDAEHVQKFADFLETNKPIRTISTGFRKNGTEMGESSIHISNKKLTDDLIYYGLIPNKTKLLQPMTLIPDEWFPAFAIGCIDSDGWISTNKNNKARIKCGFMGTKMFTEWFGIKLSKLINEDVYFEYGEMIDKTPTALFNFWGIKRVLNLCKLFYTNAEIFLPRKKQKALSYFTSENRIDKSLKNDAWIQYHKDKIYY